MPSPVLDVFVGSSTALRARARCALVFTLIGLGEAAHAQSALTHTEDAAPVPVGTIRLGVTTGWTRFDERFSASGRRSLADEISTDSLGPRQFFALAPVEAGLQVLSNNPQTRLTLGRLAAQSNARIVTTPIVLEYGLTSRLSVGLLVPVVQIRRSISLTVNRDSTHLANVGFVPALARQSAAVTNAAVYAAYIKASDSLATLLSKCPTNPSASGCAAVNANASDAVAARQQALAFANAVLGALGTDSASALIAPRAGSALALAIDARRAAVNAHVQQYLGASAGAASGVFSAASDFSYIDLNGRNSAPGLVQGPLGGGIDSIRTTTRLGTGDISVGAQYLLLDRMQHDTLPLRALQSRLVVGSSVRFATGLADSARSLGLLSAGDGAGFELKSALDLISERFGATIAARYVKSFPRTLDVAASGDPEAFFPAPVFRPMSRTAGTVIGLDVTPRFLLGELFAANLHYGIERTGATTYEALPGAPAVTLPSFDPPFAPNEFARLAQRIGAGFRYSTVEAYQRGHAGFPLEVSFTHLQTVSGDPGVAVLQRDQIQLRLFLGLRDSR